MREEKIIGRPKTPSYSKKQFRYAGIEKRFLEAVGKMESEHDKKIVLKVLESMKKT